MDSDEELSLSSKECEELIQQFVAITCTDEALAQMRLQENGWNLERAINNHLAEGGEASNPPEAKLSSSESKPKSSEDDNLGSSFSGATTRAPGTFSYVTWNVDGLDERNLRPRCKEVCKVLEQLKVDIICLQEVVPETLAIIEKELASYHCIREETFREDSYFSVILIRVFTVYVDDYKVDAFPTSSMDRKLLTVNCHIGKAKLCIMTAHLESTKDFAEERMKQLKICFKKALDADKDKTVIFGGDLNLRDKELETIGSLPSGLDDIWVKLGSRKECQYTWDMLRNTNLEIPGKYKPRCRFDRVYVRASEPLRSTADHFGLVGIEKVSGTQSFPSDHWGIFCTFKVDSN